jgi:hypothetical protein
MQEGLGKASRESLTVFLRIARGSLYETLDHLVSVSHLVKIDNSEVMYMWANLKQLFDSEFQSFTEKSIELVQTAIDNNTKPTKTTDSPTKPDIKRRKTNDDEEFNNE